MKGHQHEAPPQQQHCAGAPVKSCCSALDMEEHKRSAANASEFNPRAASSSSFSAADHPSWPLNGAEPMPDSVSHAAPKWWVSPSHAPPTAVYGSCAPRPPHHSVGSVDHSRLSLHDNGAPPLVKDALHFVADISRNNPYLDAALRSPSAPWSQMQQQQVNADDWSCNGSFSSRKMTYPQSAAPPGFDQERCVPHPVFANHKPPSAYPARVPHNFQKLTGANPLLACGPSFANVMNGDGSFKVGDGQFAWAAAADQVRNVGKSQSMRALYEENAALRRALLSMQRGSLLAMQSEHAIPGEQDRCITSDVAEGRALSMRERGRWAMQAAGETIGGHCSMWAGTPRHNGAAGPLLHGTQAESATRMHHRMHHHSWEDGATEHPLFYPSGSFGGWPEDLMYGNRDHPHWADMQENECQSGVAHEAAGSGESTSLKQLLVETDRARMNGHQWRRRHGKKKVSQSCEEVVGKQVVEEGGQCAMCGGKLRHVEGVGGKKAGLPLRLCPACHPRAADSLPRSTTTISPPLTSQTRHHVATTIFMACRPNMTNVTAQDAKHTTKKIKPKNRIADLCRHFVGLAAKPPPPTA